MGKKSTNSELETVSNLRIESVYFFHLCTLFNIPYFIDFRRKSRIFFITNRINGKCWLLWEIHRMCCHCWNWNHCCVFAHFFSLCSSRAILLLLFNNMDWLVWFGNNGVPNLYACIESSHKYIFYWNNNNKMAINFGRWLKFVITCAADKDKIMGNKNILIKTNREREFSVNVKSKNKKEMQQCYIVFTIHVCNKKKTEQITISLPIPTSKNIQLQVAMHSVWLGIQWTEMKIEPAEPVIHREKEEQIHTYTHPIDGHHMRKSRRKIEQRIHTIRKKQITTMSTTNRQQQQQIKSDVKKRDKWEKETHEFLIKKKLRKQKKKQWQSKVESEKQQKQQQQQQQQLKHISTNSTSYMVNNIHTRTAHIAQQL